MKPGDVYPIYPAITNGGEPPPEPRTATAADKPCELYGEHRPVVVQTAGHHIHPVYLQNRVYGRIQDPTLKWLCPNCHTAVHEVIGWLLGESRQPNPIPGRNVLAEARRTVQWYWLNLPAAQAEKGNL